MLRETIGLLGKEQTMTASKGPHPSLGTWKLTKSETSRPDLPHPMSGITTITEEGDTIHYVDDQVWSDGQTSKVSIVYKPDENWWPVTGSMLIDSLSVRRLEDGSSESRMKKAESMWELFAPQFRKTEEPQLDISSLLAPATPPSPGKLRQSGSNGT